MNSTHMQAAIITKYGPPEVVKIVEAEKPVPHDKEVLVRVHATTVTSGDNRIRKADPFLIRLFFGLLGPRKKILGSETAGEIEAVGKYVLRFRPGDKVYGYSGTKLGTHAEYALFPEDGAVSLKPENESYEQAASIPFGATTALFFLRDKGKIHYGQKVLIYGASGAVGSAAVQLAKYYGADVTAVCSTAHAGFVKSLGADNVIDYTREDFTENNELYDIVFDAVGKIKRSRCRKSLLSKGKFLTIRKGLAKEKKEDLLFLKKLIEADIFKAVIDRHYPMEQIGEAYRYVDQGHKKGSVVINMVNDI